jgi:hypothetical protein
MEYLVTMTTRVPDGTSQCPGAHRLRQERS